MLDAFGIHTAGCLSIILEARKRQMIFMSVVLFVQFVDDDG